jgi:transcriptional regulator with XRE-family HTH domain
MEFTDRLLSVIHHYGHNINSFSHAIGASNNTVLGRIVNDRGRRPSFELLELILKRFPALNPAWLIVGEGEMFISRPDYIVNASERLIKVCELLQINAFTLAEVFDISKADAHALRSGETQPTEDMLNKLARAYPVLNKNWLLYNEGQIFIDSVDADKFIPVFEDLPVGSTFDDLKHLNAAFVEYTTKFSSRENKTAFGLRNGSNDFSPLLSTGDYMIIKVVDIADVIPSDLVFISTSKRNYVRKLASHVDGDSQQLILVDNSGIEYKVNKADITMIGLVRSIFRFLA